MVGKKREEGAKRRKEGVREGREGKGGVGKENKFWSPHFSDQSYAP